MDLRPYQREACSFMADRPRAIYADAPGTGKTPTTLHLLRSGHGYGSKHLIVAPLPVLDHWEEEASLWYPELLIVRGDGTPAQRDKARYEVSSTAEDVALLLHYEGLRIDVNHLVKGSWTYFICDEAHRLKGRSTLVTKAARRIARRSKAVALLTGTPILNRADELWSLLNLMFPGYYTSYWSFVHEFFESEIRHFRGNPRPVEVVGDVRDDKLEELQERVRPFLIQRSLDECLPDLAEAVQVRVPVHLSAKEQKVYAQMEKHSWADLGEGRVLSASTHLAKTTRQRQMASDMGAVLGEEFAGSKAAAAVELVKDLEPEQVVVLTAFKATARRIAEETGGVVYTGDESAEERGRALSAFRSGAARVLVGTLATLGEGVDGLQVARYIVMVDRDWTPARNEQAIARLRRSGQARTVVVYHVFAEGTVDEEVADALTRKQAVIHEVLG